MSDLPFAPGGAGSGAIPAIVPYADRGDHAGSGGRRGYDGRGAGHREANYGETIGPVPDCTLHTLSRYWGPRQYYAIDYPQCGLEPLDGWLRRDAEEAAEDARFRYREDALNAESKELCGPHPAQETSRGCALFAPNKRYLSVLTDTWEYNCGMSHGLRNVRSVTFDRKTSRRVTFPDLFPDPESAKRALLPFMRASYEDIGCPDRAGLERALTYVLSKETAFTLEPDALVLYIDNYSGAA